MSQLWRCPNGHLWPTSSGADAGSAPVSCPVCGAPGNTTVPPPTHSLSGPVPPPPSVDAPPTVTGYEILGELGRGGMGIVYQARQLARDRLVALKVIRKERLAHPDMISRFRREAQAAARLSHPNIVAVYESDQEGNTCYLAMEYVSGITLQRLVEETGPLSVALACDSIRQAALGLQHAVEQGLVHRDIKPSNLMLVAPPGTPLPSRPLLKILDMGVARLSQTEESLTTLTRDGAVIGTPDYIAPEQLENAHAADIRADLYSLGCTFYFLLAGHVPFRGGTLIQKLDRQRWENPPSVDQLRSEVPPAVAAVVRRLMAKHPDDRYRTPAELAAVLEQLTRTGELPHSHQAAPLREMRSCRTPAAVVALVFTPDGSALVSAGTDRVLRLWDRASGEERLRFGSSPHEIGCLAVLPGTGQILAGQGVSVRLWDPASGRELGRIAGHTDAVRSLSVSGDGRLVLTGGDDRTVRLWELPSGREVTRLTGHRAGVTGVALSADGRLALSGSRDQDLRLWDLLSGRPLRTFKVPRGPVLGVALDPVRQAALSAHFDTTLRLWDLFDSRELRRFTGHRQMVSAVALSADGRIVSSSHDQTVRIWDPQTGAEVGCGRGHTGPVMCLALTPDGREATSGSRDQTIRWWELPG